MNMGPSPWCFSLTQLVPDEFVNIIQKQFIVDSQNLKIQTGWSWMVLHKANIDLYAIYANTVY